MSPVVAAPLVSAFIYAFAALALKRATAEGGGTWRVCFVTNWIQTLIFAPLWVLGGGAFHWTCVAQAVLTGAVFFVGQVFTFLALSRGDISVATPVLGTKVVWVAGFTVLLLHETIPATWWWAAGLTVIATALLGGGGTVKTSEITFRRSLFYGLSAAIMFALVDILAQRWAPEWGLGRFAPVMFFAVAALSLGLIPFFQGPLREMPTATWRWLIPGAVLLSVQALGIAYAIMVYGQATLVNILYSSRGVWTISTVWLVGPWFGNRERSHGPAVLVRRLCGSALILLAVKLALK